MQRAMQMVWLLIFSITTQAAPSNQNTELRHVATQIQQLQKAVQLDQQQQMQLQNKLADTEITLGKLNQQIQSINESIAKAEEQLKQLKLAQQIGMKKLTTENRILAQQIRAAYQLRHLHAVKIIFNQDNPAILQRNLNYYYYLTQKHFQLITHSKQTLAQLETILQATATTESALQLLLQQKQTDQLQQQKVQLQRQALLATWQMQKQTHQEQLAVLLANQKTLQQVITNLENKIQITTTDLPFKKMQGQLHWPTAGNIIAHFGHSLGASEPPLAGIIIKTSLGAPVKTIYSGKVIFANWLRGFGLLIIIDHGNNFMSLYGRNSTLDAKVGDHVNTGDIIATTGSSGGFNTSSLYFEIRHAGTPVNPNNWCR